MDPAGGSLSAALAGAKGVTLAVGPEGGFDSVEREQLAAQGFEPTRLAGVTLRAETAAVAALAVTVSLLGD